MKTKGMGWRAHAGLALIALLSAGAAAAQGTQQAAPQAQAQSAPPQQKLYKNEELDQMMAPVALYPDSVLSQILMACTYPSDVAAAAAWSAQHKDAKGDDAVRQVENQQWDPSVKSLVAFPQVLTQFQKEPDWVQKTGDAFLAQPEDVMEAIQRLRTQAQKAGNLKSNEQQNVIVKEVPVETSEQPAAATTNTTIIEIQPSNPETVYVPSYNPTTVYGTWAYPSYPPPYWPPSPYYYPGYYPGAALATGIMWGIGIAAIGSCWGGFGWGHGDVDINVNKYNNINRNNQINGGGRDQINGGNRGDRGNGNQKWSHNAQNRRGTPYADAGNRQKYGQGVGGAQDRAGYRGDSTRDASRQRAEQSFNRSTGNQANRAAANGGANRGGAGGAGAANRGGAGTGGGAGAANRGGAGTGSGANRASAGGGSRPSNSNMASGSRSNALSGASSPSSSQRQASRGQSSQRSMSSSGGRGASAGRQTSRSAPSRGGGGGGRRR